MAKRTTQPPPPQFGWSARHDRALRQCIAKHGTCPFGCVKDGAPNCFANVSEGRCAPAQETVQTPE